MDKESSEGCRGEKYIEGYLEKKLDGKWINYWAVIRGSAIFFFTDPNTHAKGNFVGGVEFGVQCVSSEGKNKKGCFEFDVKIDTTGKRHLFRTKSDLLRKQWLYAIGLAAQCRSPGPLPGERGFDRSSDSNTQKDYHTIPNLEAESSSTGANVAPGLNEIELQKKVTLMQRSAMSFSAFYRKKEKKKSKQEEAPQGPRPESDGAELSASSDGRVYDDFRTERPQWYLGKVTRCAAEEYLKEQVPGTFLVRDSETVKSRGAYTLSLRHFERCRHHKIETNEQGTLVIKGHDHKTFPTLELLVEFFIQSQRKEIELKPYAPSMVQHSRDTELDESDGPHSPSRTVGDGCETQVTEIQQQLDQLRSLQAMTPKRNSYVNLPSTEKDTPPPLPSRKSSGTMPHGYENIPEKAAVPPPQKVLSGYQNIPPKEPPQLPTRQPSSPRGHQNVPLKQTNSYENTPEKRNSGVPDAPPKLPARQPSTSQGYQNVPPKRASRMDNEMTLGKRNSDPLPGTRPAFGYENFPPQAAVNPPPPLPPRVVKAGGYENVPEKGGPQMVQSLPRDALPRSYQNLPPKVQPRPRNLSEQPPPVSVRPRPMRRSETMQ